MWFGLHCLVLFGLLASPSLALLYFILFACFTLCFVLFWFGLVWFGLIYFGLVWFGLVWFGWFVLFCFVLFCFVLFYFDLFYFVLFCFALLPRGLQFTRLPVCFVCACLFVGVLVLAL